MKTLNIALSVVCLSVMITACGAFKVREKDEASVQTIKRIAVVGFTVTQPASAKLGLNLSKGQLEGAAGGSMIAQNSSHADMLYSELGEHFKKNMGWNVLRVDLMKANEGYKKAYKDTMEGWQNKMPPSSGYNQFIVTGIMDNDGTRILDQKGRDALIEALNVDAIVTAQVRAELHGTSVMGIGSRRPKANLSFQIFGKGKEKPIWFDGQVEGETATESVGATGFINEDLLNDLVLRSAKTAYAKIGQSKVE
jgi:hypothetical protein